MLHRPPERDLAVPLFVITLRFLGVTEVRAADGADALAVLKQPKRLALLGYLAAAAPHRFHRRDSLLALFWPDQDQSQARRALRRALFFLRRALGSDAIVGRGDELGTRLEDVWCDVTAFQQALDAKHLDEAVELYRGDLLTGLFVESAPDFERWLEVERARLRDLAVGAAWALSDRAERSGDVRDAAQWAKQALELTPDDEAGLRRLVRLLDRSGARAAALQAYQGFVKRLAEELELEPEPETVALMETVRSRHDAPVLAGDVPAPRKRSPNLVAVLPFTVRGPVELQYLRDGMVDLLAAKLDGAGALRTVEPRSMLHYMRSLSGSEIDVHEARAVSERFGAEWCLFGSVVVTGERLHVAVTLCQAQGQREIRADVGNYGEGEIFKAVDEIARHILSQWTISYGGMMARLAAVTTESVTALKAYLVGERAFRAGRFADAAAAYEQAVGEDPTFALGHYRLAAAYAARGAPEAAGEPCARAWEHRQRLNPRFQLLVEAQAATLRGAAGNAEGLCRSVIRQIPKNVEAWFLLGETYFHYNPDRGRSIMEAHRPFERVLDLDPRHIGALTRLMRLAAFEGRTDDLGFLLERFEAAEPEAEQSISARALSAFALGDRAARDMVMAELKDDPPQLAAVVGDIAVYVRDFAMATEVAGVMADMASSPTVRAHAHLLLAYLAAASRQFDRSLEELDRVEQLDRATALLHRGLMLSQEHLSADEATVQTCYRTLESWHPVDPRSAPQDVLSVATHRGMQRCLREYVLGMLATKAGNLEVALLHADQCDAAARPGDDELLRADLARGVRARVALVRGEPARALEILETIVGECPSQVVTSSPFASRVTERFLRATVLEAVGRPEEAAGWSESMAQRSVFELVFAERGQKKQEGQEGRDE